MAAGQTASLTLAQINSIAGSLCLQMLNLMYQIQQFQSFLAATDLTQAPYSMAAADQNTLKSAFTDLDQLRQVFQGLATRTPAYDYRTFVKLIDGVGF